MTHPIARPTSLTARLTLRLAAVFALGALQGCLFFRPAGTPLEASVFGAPSADVVADRAEDVARRSSTPTRLVVLLPGLGDSPEDFVSHGFVEALEAADPAATVIAADAHFGYYREGTVVDRLHADVIEPALAQGVERVDLIGISMGGFGALAYAQAHPEHIGSVWLIAPYLGSRAVVSEVRDAGGLAAWNPGAPPDPPQSREDMTRRIWVWLSGYAHGADPPDIRLAIGTEDRGLAAATLLGSALPDDAFMTAPGPHDWVTWEPLFARLLGEATGGRATE
ncbi:MAG: alpha/beta fold hydrolase [Myxococcales bacterium]|nr:alpha/beta fold hydrolase [Myxococcales bacterium]MCB9521362.1 alpha/beta fold hydrolase [Myxococcales bacterium]